MSVEDLLKPRKKVIAPYPYSEFKVGEILYSKNNNDWFEVLNDTYDEPRYISIEWINSCPNIFQPLEWWQEIRESDMPEYVKIIYKNKSVRVVKNEGWVHYCNSNYARLELLEYLPATEEDFLNQK